MERRKIKLSLRVKTTIAGHLQRLLMGFGYRLYLSYILPIYPGYAGLKIQRADIERKKQWSTRRTEIKGCGMHTSCSNAENLRKPERLSRQR
jgi:hypothetical protein